MLMTPDSRRLVRQIHPSPAGLEIVYPLHIGLLKLPRLDFYAQDQGGQRNIQLIRILEFFNRQRGGYLAAPGFGFNESWHIMVWGYSPRHHIRYESPVKGFLYQAAENGGRPPLNEAQVKYGFMESKLLNANLLPPFFLILLCFWCADSSFWQMPDLEIFVFRI
jgi:hypothetical protein